jgi:hypothetical protein
MTRGDPGPVQVRCGCLSLRQDEDEPGPRLAQRVCLPAMSAGGLFFRHRAGSGDARRGRDAPAPPANPRDGGDPAAEGASARLMHNPEIISEDDREAG